MNERDAIQRIEAAEPGLAHATRMIEAGYDVRAAADSALRARLVDPAGHAKLRDFLAKRYPEKI